MLTAGGELDRLKSAALLAAAVCGGGGEEARGEARRRRAESGPARRLSDRLDLGEVELLLTVDWPRGRTGPVPRCLESQMRPSCKRERSSVEWGGKS